MQPPIVDDVLFALDKVLFSRENLETVEQQTKQPIMCMALRVSMRTFLPGLYDYEDVNSLENFITACSQRYETVGAPLKGLSLADVAKGYFDQADKSITCKMGGKTSTCKFDFADKVEIVNVFDLDTSIFVTTDSGIMQLDSLLESFRDDGMVFPDLNETWNLRGFERKPPAVANAVRTPKKQKTTPGSSTQSTGSSPSVHCDLVISEALRKRLQAKRTAIESTQ